MASTNKTPHLELNQWVLDDPFLMEDFNADNQKIDAAVTSIPCLKLFKITTMTDAQQVDLDVSGIDFTQYTKLELYTDMLITPAPPTSAGENTMEKSIKFQMRINNKNGYILRSGNQGYASAGPQFQCEAPCHDYRNCGIKIEISHLIPNFQVGSTMLIHGTSLYNGPFVPFVDLFTQTLLNADELPETINFTCSSAAYKIKSGSNFILYGVKV